MKIVALIARLLLGALFVFSGANHLFNFMKGPLPPGVVGQYMGIMMVSGYLDDDRLQYQWSLQGIEVFPKPFSGAEFLETVAGVLAEERAVSR